MRLAKDTPIHNIWAKEGKFLPTQEPQFRMSAKYQIHLISRTVPELSKYPCNPDDRYFGILRAIAIKFARNPLYPYKKAANKLRWKLSLLVNKKNEKLCSKMRINDAT